MPLIISIETATKVCSIALHAEGELIAHTDLLLEKSHATHLLPLIKHLLSVTSYEQKDIAAVAISSGPGSYTGLRIGSTTAKGLCYALGIPLIVINTLEGMVCGMVPYNKSKALLCPMLDARRAAVYCLLATSNGEIIRSSYVKILNKHSFQEELAKTAILFWGDGAEKYRELLGTHNNALFINNTIPAAQYIGFLAYQKYQQQLFEDLYTFEPLYLSQFEGQ